MNNFLTLFNSNSEQAHLTAALPKNNSPWYVYAYDADAENNEERLALLTDTAPDSIPTKALAECINSYTPAFTQSEHQEELLFAACEHYLKKIQPNEPFINLLHENTVIFLLNKALIKPLRYYSWLFSKICGWMVAPQAFQADDRALSASSPVF